eukprot:322978_1
MSSPQKRKLEQSHNDDYQYDPQPNKRFKSTKQNSNVKLTSHIMCIDNNLKLRHSWLIDGQCKIMKHRVRNNYYEFCVHKIDFGKNKNETMKKLRTRQTWLFHNDIKHLSCYKIYLKLNNLSIEDAIYETWIVEEIWSHKFDKIKNEILFEVKWLNFPAKHNTFEPHSHLFGNKEYINYCNENNINTHIQSINNNFNDLITIEKDVYDSDIDDYYDDDDNDYYDYLIDLLD